MPSGMEMYNASGTTVFAATDAGGSLYGSFTTSGTSGNFTDTNLIGRRLLYFPSNQVNMSYGGVYASLDSNTGVVSWWYNMTATNIGTPSPSAELVFYGAY